MPALNVNVREVTTPSDRVGLYERIARHVRSKPVTENRVTKDDVLGAVASFWLVCLASVPAAIPFILLDNARFALRISNAIPLALMFLAGYWWGRLTLSRPWIVGTAFLVIGVLLVCAAIALGG